MANKISFIIDLKNNFSTAARKVNRSIKSIGTTANRTAGILKKKLGPGIAGVAKKVGVAAKVGFAVAGVAAVAGTKKSISAFNDFEFALANLQAITGTGGEALERLGEEATGLSKKMVFSTVEIINAFTQIASAKSELLKDPEALPLVTEQILLLGTAAQISAATASRAIIGSLNQFNLGADQAERFTNVLASGSKVGASLVGETADALSNVGKIASAFGLSFEDVNAAIQVLAKSELKASEAGTGLKIVLLKLESIAGGRFATSKIGFIKSIEEISKLDLSNIILKKEFGEDAIKTMLIFQSNIELLKEWKKAITGTKVAQEQADAIWNTAIKRNEALGISFTNLKKKIGEGLAPTMKRFTLEFEAWLESISDESINRIVKNIRDVITISVFLIKTVKFLINTIDLIVVKPFVILAKILDFIAIRPFTFAFNSIKEKLFSDIPTREDIKKKMGIDKNLDFDLFDKLTDPEAIQKKLDIVHRGSIGAVTLQGEIVVSANNGAKVESTKLAVKNNNMNIGINMLPA